MNTKAVLEPGNANVATAQVVAKQSFPFLDLKAQYAKIREEVEAAVGRVLESQHFILGPEVEKLEEELRQYLGVQFAITCASGSDALLLALMALGIGPGDEVITPPFTFGATAGSIVRLGARPVFVDIDPQTFNLDAQKLECAVTSRTRAIMPVHLFGLSAAMDPILEVAARHGLSVIEDAAQAIGARYYGRTVGTIGSIGCFSFFPSKNLGGAGDGGLITTNDSNVARRLKLLRVHGSPKKYEYELVGMNSRLDAMQAAILRVKLPHLEEWTEARIRNADRYRDLFASSDCGDRITVPRIAAGCRHVYNQFVIRAQQREALRTHLQAEGIPTEIYYPHPLHLQQAYASLGHRPGDFAETERACREVLALPVFPELTAEQQESVVNACAGFYKQD